MQQVMSKYLNFVLLLSRVMIGRPPWVNQLQCVCAVNAVLVVRDGEGVSASAHD
jgi:hypothetical protein